MEEKALSRAPPSPSRGYQQPVHKTYFGRFYVCGVFALFGLQQNIGWLAFGPIPDEAKSSYGLSDTELALLPMYSPICFILFTIPFIWLMQKIGLRIIFIASVWLLAIGFTIRVFVPYVPHAHNWTWLIHLGHFMIGLVGLPVMIFPTRISSVWFPPRERTFATAVMINAEGMGITIGFIMAPLLVQQYGMKTMMYVQAELAVFVAILATIYFPSRPPSPPSTTAGEERLELAKSVKSLCRNVPFILIASSGGIILGGIFGFSALLGLILDPSGFNDHAIVHSVHDFFLSVPWMGSVAAVCGTISGQVFGLIADRFQRRFKLILILLLIPCTALCIWFSLSIYGWGSSHPINLFVTYVLINACILAAFPIFYEAAVESTYPIPEGASSGALSLSANVATFTVTVISMCKVFSDKHPGRAKAMSWVLTGLAIIATILLVFYREDYKRLNKDHQSDSIDSGNPTPKPIAVATEKSPLLIQNCEEEDHTTLSQYVYTTPPVQHS